MTLAIIAAIARNGVIGVQGKLPWNLPEDLARFKRLTMGNAVLMGRKTYQSLGRMLPGRRNVVISSRHLDAVERCGSLEDALRTLGNEQKVFVIGGARLYQSALPLADELYLTFIEKAYAGDTCFPEYEEILRQEFDLMHTEQHEGFRFEDYKRRKA